MRRQCDDSLDGTTFLHRYLTFESFVVFVESSNLCLSNVNRWDDGWEANLGKLGTIDEEGKEIQPLYSFHQLL